MSLTLNNHFSSNSRVSDLSFDGEKNLILSGQEDGTISFWNIDKEKTYHVSIFDLNGVVTNLITDANHGIFLFNTEFNIGTQEDIEAGIQVWDLNNLIFLYEIPVIDLTHKVAIAPEKKLIIIAEDGSNQLTIWNYENKEVVSTVFYPSGALWGVGNQVGYLQVNKDETLLAIASNTSVVIFLDLETFEFIDYEKNKFHFPYTIDISFSDDAIAVESDDITIWNIELHNGEISIQEAPHHITGVRPVFHPSLNILATANTASIMLWDANTGELMTEITHCWSEVDDSSAAH